MATKKQPLQRTEKNDNEEEEEEKKVNSQKNTIFIKIQKQNVYRTHAAILWRFNDLSSSLSLDT